MRIFSPGRVNLIGDHTDYTGGLALPMAIPRGITLDIEPGGDQITLSSDQFEHPAVMTLPVSAPELLEPTWARYVGGVAAELGATTGFSGAATSDLPIAGLSSSAALEVGVGLALGFDGSREDLARLCQQAEQRASGVPCGIMDQLAIAAATEGNAMLLDCRTLAVQDVPIPGDVEVVVVHSGEHRELMGSDYGERRRQCHTAESIIGPLRDATPGDVHRLQDPVLRARTRHVVSENRRVSDFARLIQRGEYVAAGSQMTASHASLRDDFEVSTPTLDRLVGVLVATAGVFGARLTGAGFGGAVVALTEPGALEVGFAVRPCQGAHIVAG